MCFSREAYANVENKAQLGNVAFVNPIHCAVPSLYSVYCLPDSGLSTEYYAQSELDLHKQKIIYWMVLSNCN